MLHPGMEYDNKVQTQALKSAKFCRCEHMLKSTRKCDFERTQDDVITAKGACLGYYSSFVHVFGSLPTYSSHSKWYIRACSIGQIIAIMSALMSINGIFERAQFNTFLLI